MLFSYYFAKFLILKRVKCPPRLFLQAKQLNFVARGPFLESPGNFTGPKSNIQIEI